MRRAYEEIVQQRGQLGELLEQDRDMEAGLPADGAQRVLSENHLLRARSEQLDQQVRRPEERLAVARANNRCQVQRVADLEAELDLPRQTQQPRAGEDSCPADR